MFEKGLIYHKIINVDLFYLFAVYIVLMIVRLLMSINRIHLEIVCVWGNCISYSDYTDNTIFYDFWLICLLLFTYEKKTRLYKTE